VVGQGRKILIKGSVPLQREGGGGITSRWSITSCYSIQASICGQEKERRKDTSRCLTKHDGDLGKGSFFLKRGQMEQSVLGGGIHRRNHRSPEETLKGNFSESCCSLAGPSFDGS